jgi:virulence-associated protein VagC
MASSMIGIDKAKVSWNGHSQSVDLPASFHFESDEVYVQRDAKTGGITLSEKPLKPSWKEVFQAFDEAAAAGETFDVERSFCLPRDIEL